MNISREESISKCQEMWETIKESGLTKDEFLFTTEGKKWKAKGYEHDCPLCSYAWEESWCVKCPLVTQYSDECLDLGYGSSVLSTPKWFEAIRGLR